MKIDRVYRLAVCSAAIVAAHESTAMEADKLFEKVSPSVFVVMTLDAKGDRVTQGSGVAIAPGKVVTNCHVLAKAKLVFVKHGNIMYGAKLEFPDPKRDLCQLDVKELNAPAVTLGSSAALKIGQRVYAIGAPAGLELTLSDGLISSLRSANDKDAPQIQTSAPISPGSSGGGLFDAEGNLIGITTWILAPSRNLENLNFAIPSDWIRELPERGKANLANLKQAAEAAAIARAAPGPSGLPPIDPTLPKEMPQVGDTWTYVARDLRYRPNDRSRKYVHTVRSADASTITEQVMNNDKPLGEFTYTQSPTAVFRAGMIEVFPFASAFRTLHPGAAWGSIPIRGLQRINQTGGAPAWTIERANVVGNERIVVPAGTFDAIKVVFEGHVHTAVLGTTTTPGLGGYQDFTETIWYAPSAKRVAKIVMEGATFTDGYELEKFTVR